MALRTSFTRVFGAVIPSAWANSIRDHLVTIATSNDVSSEGQLCVNTSTDQLVVHNGSGAIELGRYGAWSSFTLSPVQTFSLSSSNTDVGFARMGRTIVAHARLQFTSNGSTGTQLYIDTNLPAPTGTVVAGHFHYTDAGAFYYTGEVFMNGSSRLNFTVSGVNNTFGVTPSFAVVSGDEMWVNLVYQAAA